MRRPNTLCASLKSARRHEPKSPYTSLTMYRAVQSKYLPNYDKLTQKIDRLKGRVEQQREEVRLEVVSSSEDRRGIQCCEPRIST